MIVNTESTNNNMDNFDQVLARLSETEGEIQTLTADNAAIKVAVNNLTGAVDRIERKLDNPPTGPSWTAISSLVAGITALGGSTILTFIVLTADPVKEDLAEIKASMVLDNEREEREVAQLASLDQRLKTNESAVALAFNLVSQGRDERIRLLESERTELKRQIERLKERERAKGL